jgi:hypothetical protein
MRTPIARCAEIGRKPDQAGNPIRVQTNVPPVSLGSSQSALGDCDGLRNRRGPTVRRQIRPVVDGFPCGYPESIRWTILE